MSILERLFGGPQEGETRELAQPQALTGYYEPAATHLVYHDGDWQPAVVEEYGGRAFVVLAMRTWPDDDAG